MLDITKRLLVTPEMVVAAGKDEDRVLIVHVDNDVNRRSKRYE